MVENGDEDISIVGSNDVVNENDTKLEPDKNGPSDDDENMVENCDSTIDDESNDDDDKIVIDEDTGGDEDTPIVGRKVFVSENDTKLEPDKNGPSNDDENMVENCDSTIDDEKDGDDDKIVIDENPDVVDGNNVVIVSSVENDKIIGDDVIKDNDVNNGT